MMETQEFLEYEIDRPMSSKNHARVETRIATLLSIGYEEQYDILSQVSLQLKEKYTPDISIFPLMEYDWSEDEIRLSTPPITTIEIISPKQALTDVTDKIYKDYFPSGVQSAWVVIPTLRSIHILLPDQSILTFTSGKLHDPVTNIEIEVGAIFK
ncbi:MAG: Uma2 family endonuclease [Haliscomenobacter sp.]|uniref:Uma2 family endonuclease n=1 Tax=Haliscomenobacter sp. TaxID=2717303 RepID=UPI0029B8868C|nr:Uma2 family endonuclease [Haliscomenobacter sp.]MDX2069203.1 Uma2 family endonuclease [Haliscomenobacter sp.]